MEQGAGSVGCVESARHTTWQRSVCLASSTHHLAAIGVSRKLDTPYELFTSSPVGFNLYPAMGADAEVDTAIDG